MLPALRDLSRCIDRFLQSNVPPDKMKVVINRYSSAGALSQEQIEKAIRQPIAITIPNASVGPHPRHEHRQPRTA